VHMEEDIIPDESAKTIYDEGYEKYRALYQSTCHLL
jgi:hypothetical protein